MSEPLSFEEIERLEERIAAAGPWTLVHTSPELYRAERLGTVLRSESAVTPAGLVRAVKATEERLNRGHEPQPVPVATHLVGRTSNNRSSD